MSIWDGEYRARVMDGLDLWDKNLVRLVIRRSTPTTHAYLMSDGTWMQFQEGTEVTGEVGVLLPSAALEAIVRCVEEWQGHTSHADTEARVLREWLTVERERVDRVLGRANEPIA